MGVGGSGGEWVARGSGEHVHGGEWVAGGCTNMQHKKRLANSMSL